MKIAYRNERIGANNMALIRAANAILVDFQRRGYDLTLRQLYYQFVKENFLTNTIQSYKRLGAAVGIGRMNGLIDWDHIIDRTRMLRGIPTYESPEDRLKYLTYDIDKWKPQTVMPEVWVEKDALIGIVGQACQARQVNHFSCRGYTSMSEMWTAVRRIRRHLRVGQSVHIIHLGDHDPSGMDMSRDIEERIREFLARDHPDQAYAQFTFERIALNMDQIEDLQLPPNPAKLSDSRARRYVAQFGYDSWELDALSPEYLTQIIQDAIEPLVDLDLWQRELYREDSERELIKAVGQNWREIREYITNRGLIGTGSADAPTRNRPSSPQRASREDPPPGPGTRGSASRR